MARILNIEYENYEVFGKTAEDDALVRTALQQQHESTVRDTVDTVEQEAKTWTFVARLSDAEGARLQQINTLMQDVMVKRQVRTEQLRRVFTDEQFAAYEHSLEQPITLQEVLYADGTPTELKRYNRLLRDADFVFSKYERYSSMRRTGRAKNFRADTVTKTYQQSERLYEQAVMYLEECIGVAAGERRQELLRWLDRDVDFGYDTKGVVDPNRRNIGIDAHSVPRVKGSTSHYATPDAALPEMSVRKKREQRLLEALLTAAVGIAYEPEKISAAQLDEEQRRSAEIRARIAKKGTVEDWVKTMYPERD